MILLLKANRSIQNVFMAVRLKYFHDSLNIVGVLAPDHEFFCSKYAQFSLTFTE